MRLEPLSCQKEIYIVYPLVCGLVSLPRLRLVAFPDSPEAQPLDGLVEAAIPQVIQIMVRNLKVHCISSQSGF